MNAIQRCVAERLCERASACLRYRELAEPRQSEVCMYVCICLMSWGPTGGQQTEFSSCGFIHSKKCCSSYQHMYDTHHHAIPAKLWNSKPEWQAHLDSLGLKAAIMQCCSTHKYIGSICQHGISSQDSISSPDWRAYLECLRLKADCMQCCSVHKHIGIICQHDVKP